MYNDECLGTGQYGAGIIESGKLSQDCSDLFFSKLESFLTEGHDSGIYKKISFTPPEKLGYKPVDAESAKGILESTKTGNYKSIFVDNLTSTSLSFFNLKGSAPFAPVAFDPTGLFPIKINAQKIPEFLLDLTLVVSTGLLAVPSFAVKYEIQESLIVDFITNLPQISIPPLPPIPIPLPSPNVPSVDFVVTPEIFLNIPSSLLGFFSSIFLIDLSFAKSLLSFDILSILKTICSKLLDLFIGLFESAGIDFSISFLLKATLLTIVELIAASALACITALIIGTGSISKSVFDFAIDA